LLGLTRFSQSNYRALAYGNVGLVVVSLYPHEKNFFDLKLLGTSEATDLLTDFVTCIGKERIDFIQSNQDYFFDLEQEYAFLKAGENKIVKLPEGNFTYCIAKNQAHLEQLLDSNEAENNNLFRVIIVVSIEGAHCFNTGLAHVPTDEEAVLQNVVKVKNWPHKPFFITLAHHYYNELCGHAVSLPKLVSALAPQCFMKNTGFTELGKKVAKALLDNANGQRILIDIKHMSRMARKEYYQFLADEFPHETIPLIVSHGCVTGLGSEVGFRVIPESAGKFLEEDINFYDEEIERIGRSGGIFGIQLDEKRIGSPQEIDRAKGNITRRDVLYSWARLVWNQVQHIAEVLDEVGLFAWDIQCIGSDYDGIINPINGYWTSEELDDLDDYLLKHAHNYIRNPNRLQLPRNKNIHEEEIVSRVMRTNALGFMKRHFK
jgi:microsomal dipeptidase-like Zn-dependent dipeptidase